MIDPTPLGHDRQKRAFYLLELPALDAWPTDLALPSPHFALFLACNAKSIGKAALSQLATLTLNQGLSQLCAWGPGASLTMDVFEDVCEFGEDDVRPSIAWVSLTSSWHGHDTLEHAMEYFFDCARPSDPRADCGAWLAAAVGMPQAANEMRALLRVWLKEGTDAF